jgi:paraquat-inducible protein B
MKKTSTFTLIMISTLLLLLAGCQTAYYAAWEKLGKEKRHLLRDSVEKSQAEQEKASEQFKDALTRIKEVYQHDGGNLETFYSQLNGEYEACRTRADRVNSRIQQVEEIGRDLFVEWEQEISRISNPTLRQKSTASLHRTQTRFAALQKAMNRARNQMDPVLQRLQDYVLYLKHNLNAQALGALQSEVGSIENEVQSLIEDIGKSVREADAFLKDFSPEAGG